jgi:hemerythrin-like metal-binding protein
MSFFRIRSLPLHFWLPALVLGIFASLWYVITWNGLREIKNAQVTNAIDFISHDLSQLEREIEEELKSGNLAKAERALTARGVIRNFKELMAVDNEGIIILSTKLAWKGRHVSEVFPKFNSEIWKVVTSSNRKQIDVQRDTQDIFAYFPLTLNRKSDELRPSRVGSLILHHHYSEQNYWSQSITSNIPIFIAMVIALAMLIWVLNRFVQRPIRNLVAATGNYSTVKTSQYHLKTPIGEFAILGRSLASLATEVENSLTQKQKADLEREGLLENSRKRVKELRTMYSIASAIRNSSSLDQLFAEVANQIPQGWQYHKIARARVIVQDKDFVSDDFHASEWVQSADIKIAGECKGKVEVFYLSNPDDNSGDPFLKEEHDLLDGIASALSEVLEHAETQKYQLAAENKLRQAQKMEAVGQLTGGIAHDFNNILGIVLGNLELLELELPEEFKGSKRLAAISKSADRAAALTKKLLGLSRRKPSCNESSNLNEVIHEMSGLLRRSLTPAIVIRNDLEPELWNTFIDPGDLEDSLLNLAINARDAMHQGGVITIKTRNLEIPIHGQWHSSDFAPGKYVQLLVSDNGVGMSPETAERIFEPFFTTKPSGQGTGLGMAMVYGFVQRSDGNIDVQTNPGLGTTVRITLPYCDPALEDSESLNSIGSTTPHGTESILVVDDEPEITVLEADLLGSLGYQVTTCDNAREGLRILSKNPDIQLLITDIVMPGGLSGLDLAEQAKFNHPNLRIILTSGFADHSARHKRVSFAARDTLQKPFATAALAHRVREILDGPPTQLGPNPPGSVQIDESITQLLEWDESVSVGVAEIDKDHRALMKLVNDANTWLDTNSNLAQIGPLLTQIRDHSQAHFSSEEVAMAACNYPRLKQHHILHLELNELMRQATDDFADGTATIAQIRGLLGSWWLDHVRIADGAFVPYLEDHADAVQLALVDVKSA